MTNTNGWTFWLETFHNATNNANMVVYELQRLGRAFYATGNVVMSEHLLDLSVELQQGISEMDGAVSSHVNYEFTQSQKAIGETLSVIAKSIAGQK